jgi:L-Ala-D/L-Glu epimerase
MQVEVTTRVWPLREPFVISRTTHYDCEVIVVQLRDGELLGRGEAVGVDYHGETLDSMRQQIESIRPQLERGVRRTELLKLLPAGGARNAVDCALWDLEAKKTGQRAWELAGISAARPITTTLTIGIRSIEAYEERARESAQYEWLKIKVDGKQPLECLRAVRRGAPHAKLVVDPNQAWDIRQLVEIAPALVELNVALLEQPVPINGDEELAHIDLPLPICADEPLNTVAELPYIAERYDYANIKLDKSGGLTAALELAHAARAAGLHLMVGCMVGGSIAMAPGMVVGQLCEVADLDGPLLQAQDWPDAIEYQNGVMSLPSRTLWG